MNLDKFRDDRDVIEPFAQRLMSRLQPRLPDIRLEDIEIEIHVKELNPTARIIRMLREMTDEGVII